MSERWNPGSSTFPVRAGTMAPIAPRLKVLSVGGNPVSAFLSWRLQATNACDVTLVWKTGFEHVSQYGISFTSPIFGNERFKPRHVVRVPEEAISRTDGAFDYVILCVKALPDVYDLASVIDSVVTPQHTCILINTTHSLGVEAAIQERFPTNVVLSLVCGAELSQLGQSEFEHKGSTDLWVGPANKNIQIPPSIQEDMAQALAMTLVSGQVDCQVSSNIRQQQYERVIGPIAFHPLTVVFETPNYAALLEKIGVLQLVEDIIDELLGLATAQGCKFPPNFKKDTIAEFLKIPGENIMWQDFVARRPMEVETYLGSPIKLAQEFGIHLPRVETLYAILYNMNITNRSKPKVDAVAPLPSGSPSAAPSPLPRTSSQGPPPIRPASNGAPNGNGMPHARMRPRGSSQLGPAPGMRRPPPPANGAPPNGYGRPPMNGIPNGRQPSRRGSLDGNDLEEFSHLVVYDDIPEGSEHDFNTSSTPQVQDIALRERELQLRQRELALREQEMRMRRVGGGSTATAGSALRRGPPSIVRNGGAGFDDDDDDDDGYFDPASGPPMSMIDPDSFDMMSVTSRKNRKAPSSASQFRKNPEHDSMPPASRNSRFRPNFGRNRSSQIMSAVPGLHDNIMDDPLMGFTSNRYGAVDRGQMHAESRANSLTATRLDELQLNQGPGGLGPASAYLRRSSQSPGQPYSPSIRGGGTGSGRPSPPNGSPGIQAGRRPSPPSGMKQPVPRHPPGHGSAIVSQQVDHADSGESTHLGLEPSAHSSQSSPGPRPAIGVR